jgi:hypothetical protein
VLNRATLWADSSNESFYAYDGAVSASANLSVLPVPPDNALWQFVPSGNSGEWSQVSVSPASYFSTLSRVVCGIYGQGNGLGFAFGGQESDTADPSLIDETYFAPGMVVFNSTSQQWYNISNKAVSYYGTGVNGAAQFVPSFGPSGLLLVLGGRTAIPDGNWQQYFPFDNIAIYEPLSQQWSF